MRDVRVACGGAQSDKGHGGADLVLDVGAMPGALEHITLRLHTLTRKIMREPPDRLLDLLEIASYVYCADQFTKRDTLVMPRMGAGWRRNFVFQIAVREPAFWNTELTRRLLTEMLEFLSEDRFTFSFESMRESGPKQAFLEFAADGSGSGFIPDEVMMFSGGLDSFAGAAQAVLTGRKVVLVSHHASPLIVNVQRNLVHLLQQKVGRDMLLHVSVGVTKGKRRAVEFTQRTRSFLFAVLGFIVAHLFNRTAINFYENGVVSLNLPLASHVLGSRATRTTHPRVLYDIGRLLSHVAACDVRLNNPFFWLTKTEVVQRIAELGCGDLVPRTFSCANVRTATRLGGAALRRLLPMPGPPIWRARSGLWSSRAT